MELRHIFTQNNIVLCFFLNCLFTYFSAGLLFYRSLNEKISLRKCFLLLAFGISISALYAWVFKYSCQLAQVISFAGSTAVFSMSLKGNRNKTTAVDVAQARGVILLSAKLGNCEVYEYTPLQVKQSVVGYGRAEKKQVQEMTKQLLGLSAVPKPDDTADALAMAICHAHSSGSLFNNRSLPFR